MNEHIFTLRDEKGFKVGSFHRESTESSMGQRFDFVYGIPIGGKRPLLQSIHYPTMDWSAEDASSYWPEKGIFKASDEEEPKKQEKPEMGDEEEELDSEDEDLEDEDLE